MGYSLIYGTSYALLNIMKLYLATLISLIFLTANASLPTDQGWKTEETHLVRAQALTAFYGELLSQIANHHDTISGDDFNHIYLTIKSELQKAPKESYISRELGYILSQIEDHKEATKRLEQTHIWLQSFAQTLRFTSFSLEQLINRYQKQTRFFLTPSQMSALKPKIALEGFLSFVTIRSNSTHGSFIYKMPFSQETMIRSYLTQFMNTQIYSDGSPQFNNITGTTLAEVIHSSAEFEFNLKKKVSRYVSNI